MNKLSVEKCLSRRTSNSPADTLLQHVLVAKLDYQIARQKNTHGTRRSDVPYLRTRLTNIKPNMKRICEEEKNNQTLH
jgi:hypothetical protein